MQNIVNELLNSESFIHVGNFIKENNSVNLISFDWIVKGEVLRDKRGRVYFFVETDNFGNEKIIKIGKSNDKGGIKGTINFYTSTLSGSPSITRFSLHHLIRKKIEEEKNISVFVKFVSSVKSVVEGLTTSKEILVPLDVTYFEKQILDDYKEIFGNHPEWNFKESGKMIPMDLIDKFTKFLQNKRVK